MRIGFDLDGVLANFVQRYQTDIVRLTAHDLFQPGDIEDPPTWNWPELRGYTAAEMSMVWKHIKGSPVFWASLTALPGAYDLELVIRAIEDSNDVYYVTSRLGATAKRQSELWVEAHLNYDNMAYPTVIVSSEKGDIAKALKLDVFVEDNRDNAYDVAAKSPYTRIYLLNYRYNQPDPDNDTLWDVSQESKIRRVNSLQEVLDRELPNL